MNEKIPSNYDRKIAQAREQIKELPNSLEKQERAKLLRMEVWLDNAEAARILLDYIEKNPTATAKELEKIAGKKDLAHNPEALKHFSAQILKIIKSVKQAEEELESQSRHFVHGPHQARYSPAQILFRWMAAGNTQIPPPQSQCRLEEADNEMALVLYLDPAYFALVEKRPNIAGHYNPSLVMERPALNFPVIVIKKNNPQENKKTQSHEEGHGENRLAEEASRAYGRKQVWVTLEGDIRKTTVSALKETASASLEQAKKSPEWGLIMDASLSAAKDELLAEFKSTDGKTSAKHESMKKRGEKAFYDYFLERFDIKPDSELYKALWKEYEKIIDEAQAVIDRLVRGYSQKIFQRGRDTIDFQLPQRIAQMRWVLAQIPLKDWSRQIERTLFDQKRKELTNAIYLVDQILSLRKEEWIFKKYQEFKQAIARKALEFSHQIIDNQTKPLFQIIRPFTKDLELQQEEWSGIEKQEHKKFMARQHEINKEKLRLSAREKNQPIPPDEELQRASEKLEQERKDWDGYWGDYEPSWGSPPPPRP